MQCAAPRPSFFSLPCVSCAALCPDTDGADARAALGSTVRGLDRTVARPGTADPDTAHGRVVHANAHLALGRRTLDRLSSRATCAPFAVTRGQRHSPCGRRCVRVAQGRKKAVQDTARRSHRREKKRHACAPTHKEEASVRLPARHRSRGLGSHTYRQRQTPTKGTKEGSWTTQTWCDDRHFVGQTAATPTAHTGPMTMMMVTTTASLPWTPRHTTPAMTATTVRCAHRRLSTSGDRA